MSRIIFVPQYPTPMRYQEWWFWKLPQEFSKAGFDVLVLGEEQAKLSKRMRSNTEMFSPIKEAIELEAEQIGQYSNLELKDDDILFMADLSFPGLFGNVLYHKRPKRCFAYCHATSRNKLDYFAKDRHSKFSAESATASLMDVVFIGSNYHDDKIRWHNTLVTRLPYPPGSFYYDSDSDDYRENFIVSASRPTPQKVDLDLERIVERKLKTPIIRQEHNNWTDYYRFLGKSKILLITSLEDTFGYQIVDAVLNGCTAIAPNRCSYPELLPPEWLYNSTEELLEMLKYMSELEVMPPIAEPLCHQEMKDFYKNIIQVMKG